MARIILVFVALAVIATVGVAGLQAGLESAGEDTVISNESWTPDAGNVTTLEESSRAGAYYSHNVTVYDETGAEMDYGTDYIWYSDNGTVKALVGGGLDGDASAKITYGYQQTTAEQRNMAGMLGHIPQFAGLALPLGAVLLLFAIIRGL